MQAMRLPRKSEDSIREALGKDLDLRLPAIENAQAALYWLSCTHRRDGLSFRDAQGEAHRANRRFDVGA